MSSLRIVLVGCLVCGFFITLFLMDISKKLDLSAFSELRGHFSDYWFGQDVSSTCEISRRYPKSVLQWCELIVHYAQQHGLDPDLVAAVIWQESGGDPTAISRDGAVGLMQVMPRDGKATRFNCVSGLCFSNRPTSDQLLDPEYNIAYGTKLLANLTAGFGNLRDALKAYGPIDTGYYYADRILNLYERFAK